MQKGDSATMVRNYYPMAHYSKHGKAMPPEVPYYGESYPARMHEYSYFPYTYAYDVPGVMNYPRVSMYGRPVRAQSEYAYRPQPDYAYRLPYGHRPDLFGSKYTPYLSADEMDNYRDFYQPRYSRYRPSCKLE